MILNYKSIASLAVLFVFMTKLYSQYDLPAKFANVETGTIDESLLNELFDSVKSTRLELRLSLNYINLYEDLCIKYPEVKNQLDSVRRFKSHTYSSLAWENNQTNIDLALKYVDSAVMAVNDTTDVMYWRAQYGLGVIHRNNGDNMSAHKCFQGYYDFYSNPFDSAHIANVLFQFASCQYSLGKLDDASKSIIEAIAMEEKLGRLGFAANNLNTLAIIKKKAGLYDEVLPIYKRALEMKVKANSSDESKGNTIYNMANFLAERDSLRLAIHYFYEAGQLSSQSRNLLSYVSEGLGTAYLGLNELDSATHYLEDAYNIRKDSGSDIEVAISEFKLGLLANKKEEFHKAIRYFEKALPVSEKLNQTERVKELTLAYSFALEHVGNYKESLAQLHRHLESKDQFLNQEIAQAVEEVSVKYETDKKENEIALLNTKSEVQKTRLEARERQLLSLGVGASVLFGFLLLVVMLYNKIKNQKDIISRSLAEKDTLLKEIHHRVKNNLQVISALLTLQSKHIKDDQAMQALQEGQGRVQSMALIHQDLYQHDNLKGVNTKEYFEKLVQNLVETYNADSRVINVDYDIDALVLDVDSMIPLGLVVNELTSNALKHGLRHEDVGKIYISLREHNAQLILRIKDNGPGADIENMQTKSFGYSLIRSFARRLEADLDIENNDGLSVLLKINNYQKVA